MIARDEKPNLTLKFLVERMRAIPRSVEMEMAVQDFLELSLPEQMEIIFTALVHQGASTDWCVKALLGRSNDPR